MAESLKAREDKWYNEMYGDIPDDQLGRLAFILGKKADNKKFSDDIQIAAKKIKRIKKETIRFTMWRIFKPSARPRANTRSGYVHMYVPRARENGDWFSEFCIENNLPLIETPCTIDIKVYQKTPSSFSIKRKVLAELGLLRPWNRTGDFDNYAKAVTDAIQHGMLADDCLVIDGRTQKFYSCKPHVDVEITYLAKDPNEVI